jgi:3-dehydroquinate synthase
MGSGKTTAGRAAAAELGLLFFDLDDVITRRAGMAIAEIFKRDGEEGFRTLEKQALKDAAKLSASVIAVGGGAVTQDAFSALAATGTVVVLQCDPATAAQRLGGEAAQRPLLQASNGTGIAERLTELNTLRAEAYATAGELLDTTNLTPQQVATALCDRVRADVSRPLVEIECKAPAHGSVVIGSLTAAQLATHIREKIPSANAAVVVADAAVKDGLGRGLKNALHESGLQTSLLSLPAGEQAKTLENLASLWTSFTEIGLSQRDLVVAVGGGATTDTAGFAAASFARGVVLVNVPTTLLAMVDASIGGKVGINFANTKNAVGAIHQAVLVVIDVANLEGLPATALRQGLSETVKAAILASPLVIDSLEQADLDDQGMPDRRLLTWLIEQAVRIKVGYVNADLKDTQLRHSLNLGHTFAHALESVTEYKMSHGDAVAVGMINAARLGESVGVTAPGTAARIEKLLTRLGLPVAIPDDIDLDVAAERMRTDKKQRNRRNVFVVPAADGCALVTGVEPRQALAAAVMAHV